MIRPAAFGFNPQTFGTNVFQSRPRPSDARGLVEAARREFDGLHRRLRLRGLEVIVVPDRPEPATPDAVFPNNWVSFHADGTVILYPMYAPLRRLERRNDVIERLSASYGFRVRRRVDLTRYEHEARFLEGTGSLVFDHLDRVAYACVSERTDAGLVDEVTALLRYEAVVFGATDARRRPIYHTNVMMSIGTAFAVVCADAITDARERGSVLERLRGGRELILVDRPQMTAFACNVLELIDPTGGRFLAMSSRARAALRPDQLAALETHLPIVSAPIPTIESVGGGSVRCMIAEVFLPRVPDPEATT